MADLRANTSPVMYKHAELMGLKARYVEAKAEAAEMDLPEPTLEEWLDQMVTLDILNRLARKVVKQLLTAIGQLGP